MQVRCPQCEESVEIGADSSLAEIACQSCGSGFSLYRGDASDSGDPPNATIGHFQLMQRLGAGAFGVVWKARDVKLDRVVALKVPRLEQMDLEQETQFFNEAQAAAQLRHPNIVSIHEVGRDGETIYIVNDFINGMTLAEYLAGPRPDFRFAAELCAALADGLQHAHEVGVVHRDLKPGNIMLDRNDRPYIMDFGLAKRDLGDVTVSLDGKIMGTPAYMSPEQASGKGNKADGRTDIYSLGGILFELLTGERPFRGSLRMLMHQVINDEPPPPTRLNANVPRDLETICLKCLRKSPDARYASAAELAADLRRWLRREPIEARPISSAERLVRWCQRRPAVATLSGLVALLTVVGFSGITWQWMKADRMRIEAEANLEESERQRDRRDANFETALAAVDTMLTRVADQSLAQAPRMQRVRRSMLEDAVRFYEGFLVEKSDDPDLIAEAARSYARVGDIRVSLNEMEAAGEAFEKSIAMLEALIRDNPDRPSYHRDLVKALASRAAYRYALRELPLAIADSERAVQLHQDFVDELPSRDNLVRLAELQTGLGGILTSTTRVADSESILREAVKTLDSLPDPDATARCQHAVTLNNLAEAIRKQKGNSEEVQHYLEQSLALLEPLCEEFPENRSYHVSLATTRRDLAYLLSNTNQLEDAEIQFRELKEDFERLASDYPHIPEYEWQTAVSAADWAIMYARAGKLPLAIELLKENVAIAEKLIAVAPLPSYRRTLGINLNNLGSMLINSGQAAESEPVFERSLEIREALLEEFPDLPIHGLEVNIACTNFANTILVADETAHGNLSPDRLKQADALLVRAIQLGESLVRSNDDPDFRHKLAITYRTHGQLWKNHDPAKAEKSFRESLVLVRQLSIDAPQDVRTKRQLSYTLDQLANVLSVLDREQEAMAVAIEAYEVVKSLAEETGNFAFRHDYAINTRRLGERFEANGDFANALSKYQQSIELGEAMLEEVPDNPATRHELASGRDVLARFLATCADADFRNPELAVQLSREAVDSDPENEAFHSTLGIAHYRLGDWQSAHDALLKARQLGSQVHPDDELYMAMALWQTEQKTEAVNLFRNVTEAPDGNLVDDELRSEAANLLEIGD